MTKMIAVAMTALVASACATTEVTGPTVPTSESRVASLEFSAAAVSPGQSEQEPFVRVEGGAGRIVVEARLNTPDPCRTLSAELTGSTAEPVLEVTVRPSGAEACIQMIGTFQYQAAIRGLNAGTYRLKVVHTYASTGWPRSTVADQQVQVR
jgi:hypothetical protein